MLSRLELVPVDVVLAELATRAGATYGLRAADAIHLTTAIHAGADRFITNNQRDFPRTIREIDVVYPEDLPDPAA
jgi:predicted nucleic acid-binding protein